MLRLDDLKRKIGKAKDLHSVVRTMKSLAMVNVKQYERAVESLTSYSETIELGLQVLLQSLPADVSDGLSQNKKLKTAVIIFGSEMGLTGRFNEQIVSFALERLEKNSIEPSFVVIAGEKVRLILEENSVQVNDQVMFPSSPSGLHSVMLELLFKVEQWIDKAAIERIIVFHNVPVSGFSYKPAMVHIIPLDPEWLYELRQRKWKSKCKPLLMAGRTILFSLLVRNHIYGALVRAIVDSLASENISRLLSMQVAEKNISDRIDYLVSMYNHQRQDAITAELLDIVGGAEALS